MSIEGKTTKTQPERVPAGNGKEEEIKTKILPSSSMPSKSNGYARHHRTHTMTVCDLVTKFCCCCYFWHCFPNLANLISNESLLKCVVSVCGRYQMDSPSEFQSKWETKQTYVCMCVQEKERGSWNRRREVKRKHFSTFRSQLQKQHQNYFHRVAESFIRLVCHLWHNQH